MTLTIEPHKLRRAGLRFSSSEVEAGYRTWRVETALPFVRVGFVASLLNWLLFMPAVHLISPNSLPHVLPGAAPFILLLILLLGLTFLAGARNLIMPLAALSNFAAGSLLIWEIHEVVGFQDAAEIMSLVNMVAMFFGFIIFRLPPGLATVAVTPYLALCLYLLTLDMRQGQLLPTAYWAHVVTQLISYMNGILVALVLEVVTRRAYINHCLFHQQQERLEQSQTLIRRYLPGAVADHIIAG